MPPHSSNPWGKWLQSGTALLQRPKAQSPAATKSSTASVIANTATVILLDSAPLSNQGIIEAEQVDFFGHYIPIFLSSVDILNHKMRLLLTHTSATSSDACYKCGKVGPWLPCCNLWFWSCLLQQCQVLFYIGLIEQREILIAGASKLN